MIYPIAIFLSDLEQPTFTAIPSFVGKVAHIIQEETKTKSPSLLP